MSLSEIIMFVWILILCGAVGWLWGSVRTLQIRLDTNVQRIATLSKRIERMMTPGTREFSGKHRLS